MRCSKPDNELVSSERLIEILENENCINVSVKTETFGMLMVDKQIVNAQIKPILKHSFRKFRLSYIYHSDKIRYYLFIH